MALPYPVYVCYPSNQLSTSLFGTVSPVSSDPQELATSNNMKFVFISGAIPGMTRNTTSQVYTGIPTTPGTYTIAVQVNYVHVVNANFWVGQFFIDSGGNVQQVIVSGKTAGTAPTFGSGTTVDGTVTWQNMGLAGPLPTGTSTVIVVAGFPTFSTNPSPFAPGVVGQNYWLELDPITTSPTATLAITAGSLPPGLSVNSFAAPFAPGLNGPFIVTGTCSTPGAYEATLQFTGSLGDTGTMVVSFIFTPLQSDILTFGMILPPGAAAVPYSFQISQDFGVSKSLEFFPPANFSGPYTFTKSGTWPAFLSLSAAGLITGTPTGGGGAAFSGSVMTVTITSATAHSLGTATLNLSWLLQPFVSNASSPTFGSFIGFATAGHFGGGTK